MSFRHDSAANVAHLARAAHIPAVVAQAWLRCEAQGTDNPTNPLNVRYYGHPGQHRGPGATGAPGVGFARYDSATAGLDDAARIVNSLVYYQHLRDVRNQSPLIVAHAIEDSPWAGGHYGRHKGRDGCISRQVRKDQTPAPAPTVLRYKVQPGDTLSGIAGKLYHDTNLWVVIYNRNRVLIGSNPNLIHPGQVLVIPRKPKG